MGKKEEKKNMSDHHPVNNTVVKIWKCTRNPEFGFWKILPWQIHSPEKLCGLRYRKQKR